MMTPYADLTGQKFGSLTVVDRAPNTAHSGNARWMCICQCGRRHVAMGYKLRLGQSQRCRSCAGRVGIETAQKNSLGQPAPEPRREASGPTKIERQYRTMLEKRIRLPPDNAVRFSNFSEVRLYDRLIHRDVDSMGRDDA